MIINKEKGLENQLRINDINFNESASSHSNLEQSQKSQQELLTREETAKFFHVDLSTLHNWKKKGILIPVGIGGRVYYRMADIESGLTPLN